MNCTAFLVTTIVHAGHRHAVVVVKEAGAQPYELESNVHWLVVVLNNGCSIFGISSEQNTLLNIICRLRI